MKNILIIILSLQIKSISAQHYKLQYRHQIHPKSGVNVEVGKADVNTKSTVPFDSSGLQQMVIAMLKDQMQDFDFICQVELRNDSSFVHLENNKKTNTGIQLQISENDFFVVKGRKYSELTKEKSEPDTVIVIHATKQNKRIKNYNCVEYVNDDSTVHIWFCKELPVGINPGIISLSNYPGAILEYSRDNKKVKDSYTLNAINKLDN